MTNKKIVLATLGSLGDLHPFMALALGLRARGADPVLATSEDYRSKVTAAGIALPRCDRALPTLRPISA